MLLYQLVITALLLPLLGVAIINHVTFAEIRRGERPRRRRRISVLVPARNEERSIEGCLTSLIRQRGEGRGEEVLDDFEVILLDDGSEDRTGEIARRLAETSSVLRVIRGEPLPPGWVGKNWACHQLALQARGDLLIFTDADTVHDPESIAACAAFAERSGAELFSGVPRQRMVTFWERAVVPLAPFLYYAYLPNRWITTKSDPRFVAANGQLLAASRRAYDMIGGHEAVRENLVEDVALARLAKRRGVKVALADASAIVECRMYRSRREVLTGFSKNLFPGLGYSVTGLILFVLSFLLLYVAPLPLLAAAVITGATGAAIDLRLVALPAAQLAMAGAIRWMVWRRFGPRPRMGVDGLEQLLLQPAAAAAAAAIAINSARWAFRRDGIRWKGRGYARGGSHGGSRGAGSGEASVEASPKTPSARASQASASGSERERADVT